MGQYFEYRQQWNIVNYVQLFVFSVSLVLTMVLMGARKTQLTYYKGNTKVAFILVYEILQVAGAILGLVFMHLSKFNSTIYIICYVFDSAAIGFLIQVVYSGFEMIHAISGSDLKISAESRLLSTLLLAGMATYTAGSSILSNGNADTSYLLMKIGGFLFLAVTVLIFLSLVRLKTQSSNASVLLFLTIVFVIVQIIYSLIVSFHKAMISTDQSTKFISKDVENNPKYLLYFGDYKYYLFMSLMMSICSTFTLVFSFFAMTNFEVPAKEDELSMASQAV
ncbi:hypothetical protein DASC09_047420 [Saccharomycopsis crataegensis]|uniref:Chitin synthase export chaperone n=1 Tax=Saccharomycopsis crataegensis TaxID=43959 RepID=A0AAV5QSN9_9ASCO|nr:hypothetical protein DASC09_047420 [Saccharomycopsis crataegensis]